MSRKKKFVPPNSYLEIGETFKKYRLNAGLTLKQVSDFIGYKFTTRLSMVENGTSLPAHDDLQKLCELFNLPFKDYEIKIALALYRK
jgi:transcriptional regulator with XRE-family HTH domain